MKLSSTQGPFYGKKATLKIGGSLSGSFTGEYTASQNSETGEISVSGSVEGSKCVTTTSGAVLVVGWERDIQLVDGSFSCPTCCEPESCCPLGTIEYTPIGSCGGKDSKQTSDCVITRYTGKSYQNFSVGFSYKISKKGKFSNFVWGVSYSGPENTSTAFDFYPQAGSVNLSINGGPGERKPLYGRPGYSFDKLTAGGSISIQLDKEG
jgi:hypothetical protein